MINPDGGRATLADAARVRLGSGALDEEIFEHGAPLARRERCPATAASHLPIDCLGISLGPNELVLSAAIRTVETG